MMQPYGTTPRFFTLAFTPAGTVIPLPVLNLAVNIAEPGEVPIWRHKPQNVFEAAESRRLMLLRVEDILDPKEYSYGKQKGWYVKEGFIHAVSNMAAQDAIIEIMIQSHGAII